LPLFAGYIFLHGGSDARLFALESNLLSRCLWVEEQEQLRADLIGIRRCIEAGKALSPVARLEPGTWVEITSGALKGTRGKVLEQNDRLKFVVEVQFLNQGASLEIDNQMVRPVNGATSLEDATS
jgi:transcription antitermination factor NusG